MKKLRDWQKKAIKKWEKNNFIGTIEAATGTGKTVVGLHVIKNTDETVLITVPTISLQQQWFEELSDEIDESDIGMLGGGYKYENERVLIAVINSVRNKALDFDILIMDEIHRVGSNKNKKFIDNGSFQKILGLSATPERIDEEETEWLEEVAPIVYRYKRKKAIDDGILSNYSVIFKGIDLTLEEAANYIIYNSHIKAKMPFARGREFMQLPYQLRRAIMQRRKILQTAENKVSETINIIEKHPKHKIIVFTESIDIADEINMKVENSVIYHSKTDSDAREDAIKHFKNGISPVLVTVRALDEGLNVPNTDMAIFTAGNKTKRQTIQRIGRILRKAPGKHAKIFFMYCKNTVEASEMKTKEKLFEKDVSKITWK